MWFDLKQVAKKVADEGSRKFMLSLVKVARVCKSTGMDEMERCLADEMVDGEGKVKGGE